MLNVKGESSQAGEIFQTGQVKLRLKYPSGIWGLRNRLLISKISKTPTSQRSVLILLATLAAVVATLDHSWIQPPETSLSLAF